MTNVQVKSTNLLSWVESLMENALYPELQVEKLPQEVPFTPFNFDHKSA